MPYNLEVTLNIPVNSSEEADKIMQAVFSGLAADLVRIGVLHGMIPVMGGGEANATTHLSSNSARQEDKQREASMKIQRHEFDVSDAQAATSAPSKKTHTPVKRPSGLANRRRVGRV